MTSSLTEVARYRRSIGASLERVWENVLDWEHLPWLHSSSFATVDLEEARPDGWRARVGLAGGGAQGALTIEIRTEVEANRYVTRTLAGTGEGTEIWTSLDPRAARETAIEVRFLVPGVAAADVGVVGDYYRGLYARLWDEDERMMRRREEMLSRVRAAGGDGERVSLGTEEQVRARLLRDLEVGGQPFRIAEVDGELVLYSTVCPHAFGPLRECLGQGDRVRCPWHGYEFDVRTGRSCDGRGLRLMRRAVLEIDDGRVYACLAVPR